MSIRSIRELMEELQQEGFKYLPLCRVNSDVCENLFSQIRAMGNDPHPGPVAMIQRMDAFILRSNKYALMPCSNPNTITNDSQFLTTSICEGIDVDIAVGDAEEVGQVKDLPSVVKGGDETSEDDLIPVDINDDLQRFFEDHGHDYLASNNTSEIEESVDKIEQSEIDGLSYIGGFLCKKLIKEFPFLGHKTGELENDDYIATE